MTTQQRYKCAKKHIPVKAYFALRVVLTFGNHGVKHIFIGAARNSVVSVRHDTVHDLMLAPTKNRSGET